MKIKTDIKLDYDDVLLEPKRSSIGSRSEIILEREYTFRHSKQSYVGIPLVAANMDGVGTISMACKLADRKIMTCLSKFAIDQSKQMEGMREITCFNPACKEVSKYVSPTIGLSKAVYGHELVEGKSRQELNWLAGLLTYTANPPKFVCIDVANGYSRRFSDFVKLVRDREPNLTIIAGNVCTPEQVYQLIDVDGADIVKVGIGPGAQCLTRVKSGCGYPQLSAVVECADAAHGVNGHIIADGGCTNPADVVKAFAAGADFVMLGSMLAGTDQSEQPIIEKHYQTNEVIRNNSKIINETDWLPLIETRKFVEFYGMSSKTANDKHFGGMKGYRSSEGRTSLVPYKGDVGDVIDDILGGIRSACTYVGAESLKALPKCATFIRVEGKNTHNRSHEGHTIGE